MHTLSSVRRIGVTLILTVAATCALAATPTLKTLNVGNTSISLAWDKAWEVSKPGPDAPPNTAQFQTSNPDQMLVMLSAETRPTPNADSEAFMHHVMDQAVKEFGALSVEKQLVPKAFANGDTHGYRVCATDRAPKPGEWKYVCQGVAVNGAGDVAVIFTVLYNDSGKAQAEKASLALEALQIAQKT